MEKKAVIFLILIILCSFETLGFFYNNNFIISTIDSALYLNKSSVNQVKMYISGGVLVFNGTNAGTGLSTFLQTKQGIAAQENGSLSFSIQIHNIGVSDNDHFKSGIWNTGTSGFFIANDHTSIYVINGTGLRTCGASTKTLDSAQHTIFFNVTRGYNSTGSAKNTTYSLFYDGVFWCSNFIGNIPVIYANLTDDSLSGTGHTFYYDNFQFSDNNFTVSCLPKPTTPIFAYDDFSYNNYIDSCYWYPAPAKSILPANGQLCYDGSINAQEFIYYLSGEGNFYSKDVFTETFDLILTSNSYFEHDLSYLLLSGGGRKAYTLDFFSVAPDTFLQYVYMDNGTSAIESICSNCWNPNISNNIKITSYGYDAIGYTQLNKSSNTWQSVQPNTFSIQINNGTTYFNLPIIQPSGDYSNIPYMAGFFIDGGDICLDNYKLFSGLLETAQQQINQTGTPFLQTGEKCKTDWECFTGYCNYLKTCDKKGFGTACINNFECLSLSCSNGVCTKPTLWQITNQAKTDIVGNDMPTNNLISITIALFISIIVAILVFNMGGASLGAIAGGMVFVITLFFFTLAGWLSPFILIGLVIVIILLIMLIFFLSSGG